MSLPLPCLLIDQSNSFTKVALLEKTTLNPASSEPTSYDWIRRFPTSELTFSLLQQFLSETKAQQLILASVVPQQQKKLLSWAQTLELPLLSISSGLDLGVSLVYPDPTSIGADRLANAVAVKQLGLYPSLIVDFGTAITFDILDKKGAYQGGVIAPGLFTASKALHQQTAQLPLITPSPITQAIGKNTTEAIQIGLLLGAAGLVQKVTQAVAKELQLSQAPLLIGTGGDASLLQESEQLFDYLIPHLTLYGLEVIGKRTLNKK